MLRFLRRDLHPAEFDDATHLENATLSTRLRFTSNPALVILLGAVIVVAGCCSEMAFRNETSPPLSTLFSGFIPGLLLVAIIARASIQLWHLQSQMEAVQRSFVDLRMLTASLGQSIIADRSNLKRLHESAIGGRLEFADSIHHVAANFEHTHLIAQRLSNALRSIEVSLDPRTSHPFDRTSSMARLESQHQTPTAMKLRTLPNGSLDHNQLVELR